MVTLTSITNLFRPIHEEGLLFKLPLHQVSNEASAQEKLSDNSSPTPKARRLPRLRCVEQTRFTVAKVIAFDLLGGISWNHVRHSPSPIPPLLSTPLVAEVGVGTGTPAHVDVLCRELCEDRDAGIGVVSHALGVLWIRLLLRCNSGLILRKNTRSGGHKVKEMICCYEERR